MRKKEKRKKKKAEEKEKEKREREEKDERFQLLVTGKFEVCGGEQKERKGKETCRNLQRPACSGNDRRDFRSDVVFLQIPRLQISLQTLIFFSFLFFFSSGKLKDSPR